MLSDRLHKLVEVQLHKQKLFYIAIQSSIQTIWHQTCKKWIRASFIVLKGAELYKQ